MPKMFKVLCCVLQLAVNLSARAWALLSVSCKHLFLSILSSSFLTTWHSDGYSSACEEEVSGCVVRDAIDLSKLCTEQTGLNRDVPFS